MGSLVPSSRTALVVGLAALPITLAARALAAKRAARTLAGKAASPGGEPPSLLEPEDWDDLRKNAHALLDASLDRLQSASSEERVWTPLPDAIKEQLRVELPTRSLPHDEIRERLQELLPYGVGNTHPRFFGWVHGAGNPGGILPELVGAAMNANCGGRDHAAIYVERQVLAWCRSMMGFPEGCGGLLVSGTSLATILALKAARDSTLGHAASRTGGLADAQQPTVARAHRHVARLQRAQHGRREPHLDELREAAHEAASAVGGVGNPLELRHAHQLLAHLARLQLEDLEERILEAHQRLVRRPRQLKE